MFRVWFQTRGITAEQTQGQRHCSMVIFGYYSDGKKSLSEVVDEVKSYIDDAINAASEAVKYPMEPPHCNVYVGVYRYSSSSDHTEADGYATVFCEVPPNLLEIPIGYNLAG